MKDYSELKKLAEAATPGHWVAEKDEDTIRVDSSEPLPDIIVWCGSFGDSGGFNSDADKEYIAAANPAAVLALIADNERLKVDLREQKDAKLGLSWAIGEIMGERDKLKIEVEVMRNLARELRGSAECTNVNHCKSEQHDTNESCKVLARIDAAMSNKE